MNTKMTRKGFLGAASGGTVLLLLQACGGGGSDGAATPAPNGLSSCSSTGAAISGNHGHSLSIQAADLNSTSALSYSIQGSSTHAHTITLSPTQLAALKAGQSVTVTSSTDLSHDHSVMITCA
ncbi:MULTISPECIES: hypothetical protein [Roseateles]|uniref:Ig-like domain-containing protein n=1 Tax=Pelomonas aquatica TaxID=431058 RepID=A0ABU1Z8Z2_9BURK|nr:MULTISPECIES: hypothetical protein [Roseateles]KQY90491.1 hypothetical protein ASD35_01390 [Pelomonas sp. Root1444]MDR7297070.1 hypothetical protein [Pelomonas aquatica]